MPLDTASQIMMSDPLIRMGVMPVPVKEVDQYKLDYRREYLKAHPHRSEARIQWQTISYRSWRKEFRWMPSLEDFLTNPLDPSRRNFSRYFVGGRRWRLASPDYSSAPRELIMLATRVEQDLPEAEFAVDYLNSDPILKVGYRDLSKSNAGVFLTAYLGIWDEGVLKAIAKS